MSDAKLKRKTAYTEAIRRLRGAFLAVGLFSAAVNMLMLTGPMFMLQVYDRVLSSGSVPTLQALYVIVVVLFVFLGVYDFLRSRVMSRAAMRLDQSVSDGAYAIWLRSAVADTPMGSIARWPISPPYAVSFPARLCWGSSICRGFLSISR